MEGTNQVQDATICPVPGFIPQPARLTEKRVTKTEEWGERQVCGEEQALHLVLKNHTVYFEGEHRILQTQLQLINWPLAFFPSLFLVFPTFSLLPFWLFPLNRKSKYRCLEWLPRSQIYTGREGRSFAVRALKPCILCLYPEASILLRFLWV